MLLKYHSGEVERKTTSINKGPWNWRSFRAFPSYYLGKQTCLCVLRCRTQVDPLQEHQPHLQPLWELTNHRKPQQKTKGKTDPRPWPDMTPTHCYYLGQWHAPHKDLESPTAKKKVWVRLHIVFSFSMFVVLTIKVPFAFWSLNCAHLSFIHHHCTFLWLLWGNTQPYNPGLEGYTRESKDSSTHSGSKGVAPLPVPQGKPFCCPYTCNACHPPPQLSILHSNTSLHYLPALTTERNQRFISGDFKYRNNFV